MRWVIAAFVGSFTAVCAAAQVAGRVQAPDFNREVRPILANHCFKCHGPDDKQRMAGLRLDQREAAVSPLKSGKRAIVPAKPEFSELIRRIFSSGPQQMPPAHANKPLSESQKQTLERWIASGAGYALHWAFVPPKRPNIPNSVIRKTKNENPIDSFILARLEREGLRPSAAADRYTLVRRVYLDLIGLPPTPEEADEFVNDSRPDAYERLVDKLLASPHYGERWARKWLDLARYADTNGFEKDRPRSIWPYRDWVINALNADMQFDQFTIEQIAGDMLPNATPQHLIATGFHRNTMLNEEGGIDPLEYRFYSVVDRVSTTGTSWLGLTVGCAQCHTHKFDPITHREYYRFMAFLNNADEPEMEIEKPEITAKRREIEAKVAALEASLADRFPAPDSFVWSAAKVEAVSTDSGARAETLDDGSILLSGRNPESDTYTVTLEVDSAPVFALRIEALTHASLGGNGPGRTPHGNFVLGEVTVAAAPKNGGDPLSLKLTHPETDFAQDGFPAANAIDGNPKTGWAIHGPGQWNVNRRLTLSLEKPVQLAGGSRWTVKLDQQHGSQHTLGRFRILLGSRIGEGPSVEARRKEHLRQKYEAWLTKAESEAVSWVPLRPAAAKGSLPLLTILDDNSIIASGDQSKRDTYDINFRGGVNGTTAIRLEVLPDSRLPKHGPGRVSYEGPIGDFFLSEATLTSGGAPVKIVKSSVSFGASAAALIDGDPQTGWSISGGQGKAHTAVFNLAQRLGRDFDLHLLFERYYAAGLGRFRVSVAADANAPEAGPPPDVEEILRNRASRTEGQNQRLMTYFLTIASELKAERDEIEKIRRQIPPYPTTLVFAERPPVNPRSTYIHRRGEFLQAREPVDPGIPSFLNPLPEGAPRNRLTFAKWLVDRRNPLTARVIVNRQWAAIFGRGIVRTLEDFGYQGEPPTHPELLDWLAIEFMNPGIGSQGPGVGNGQAPTPDPRLPTPWSLKRLHKLIVMSATYRQSSRVTPELMKKDPLNRLLARGPRLRLEAEVVRDSALTASGLLTRKIGGPSVFPPQEPGITTQGVYGPLDWKVSQGEDRYRRGMYTFMKRTAPYASFLTFDGISGEACIARREVSNTPLQALTLLNDAVFVEAAQELGKLIGDRTDSVESKAVYLFRRCLTRPPSPDELRKLVGFYQMQRTRFETGELKAAAVAAPGNGEVNERAAWTALARTLLNLDEGVTRG